MLHHLVCLVLPSHSLTEQALVRVCFPPSQFLLHLLQLDQGFQPEVKRYVSFLYRKNGTRDENKRGDPTLRLSIGLLKRITREQCPNCACAGIIEAVRLQGFSFLARHCKTWCFTKSTRPQQSHPCLMGFLCLYIIFCAVVVQFLLIPFTIISAFTDTDRRNKPSTSIGAFSLSYQGPPANGNETTQKTPDFTNRTIYLSSVILQTDFCRFCNTTRVF